MPGTILHFGQEIDECFPLLRQSGYSIHCSQSVINFDQLRHAKTEYDLVSSANIAGEECLVAAERAREHFLVPAILFQAAATGISHEEQRSAGAKTSDYDLVIPAGETSTSWIFELDDLIARGRRLRSATRRIIANSLQLRQETARVIERTNLEIGRAKLLFGQDYLSRPISNMLADRVLKCKLCGENFVFTAGEQLLFQLHGATRIADRCGKCSFDSASR